MDIDQIKTFLAVAANGTFIDAASRMHVTQSTISARIQNLEGYLGATLFIRNRSGAALTPAGKRFIQHAKSLVLTLEQARHDIGLPSSFRASIKVGARIALWEGLLTQWVGDMRKTVSDISISCEIGFEEDLVRRLIEGTLDIGLMYTPQQSPGLMIEQLFDETLVLVTSNPERLWPDQDYIYVDWGPAFYAQHSNSYPDLQRPAQVVNIGWLAIQLVLNNGGSCFVPIRMARSMIRSRLLHLVPDSPRFQLPVYTVHAREYDEEILGQFLVGIREMATMERMQAREYQSGHIS